MFNQPGVSAGRSGQANGTISHNNSGSALQAASAKIKRKQVSPKAATSSHPHESSTGMKSPGLSGASSGLKYAAAGVHASQTTSGMTTSQQNFLDKYSTKTRNKIGHTVSASQPGQVIVGNSDSVSSGNGGQPAMYPGQVASRKLHSNGQPLSSYKPQGGTSYSPTQTSPSSQAGKLLFAQHAGNHVISHAAIQTAGMQGFEEATKRQEHMTTAQQQAHVMAMRNNPNYIMQRSNGGSKKELLRNDDYARAQMAGGAPGESSPLHSHTAANGGGMSPEYYSRNPRTKGAKPTISTDVQPASTSAHGIHPQGVVRQQAPTSSSGQRTMTKTGAVSTNFMKRRVSEDKAGELNTKIKPTLQGTRGNAIAYAEYLDQSKARSPKIYQSKHLEQLKQQQNVQMTQTQMFNARAMAARPQVSSQTKQYQYLTNSATKSGEGGMMQYSSSSAALVAGKSRNAQVTSTTSQGSLGNKYKSQTGTSKGYALSPKAMAMSRDGASSSKIKFGLKSSPKHQVSPTAARIAPVLSQGGGPLLNADGTGRNIGSSIRTKHSLGTTTSQNSQMNYIRASSGQGSQNIGLSPTAQYKKVLMKGPMPLMAGKVLDDNDDEEDDYDDDDMDEQSPSAHGHMATMAQGSRAAEEAVTYSTQTSQQREKEQQMQQRAARIQSQREQYQKQQRRLLRNIWIYTEKGNYQACYDLLIKQDSKLAQALLNECNSDGWTPLHVASNEGHVEMIEIFAQFGAHLDCKAKNLRTPLHVTCIRGNAQVLQALLNQGADYDAKDCDGNTPCHMISQYGHTQCLEVLLEKHPKLVTKNKDGVSPMDVAYNKEILAIFQDYINRVQNIFASQQSSSKYSTSSRGSGNGSVNAGNVKDGASSKVPNSLSKPERQNSQTQLRQPVRRASPEESKVRMASKQQQQMQAQSNNNNNVKDGSAGNARESPQPQAARPQSQRQQTAQKPTTQVPQNKTQNKNVPIHDSLNKHGDGKHKKTPSHGQLPEEAIVSSNVSSLPDEETLRVGPEDFMPLKILGSGSFGEVYLVREIRTGDLFAMKVLTKAKIFGNNLVRYAKTERDVLSYTKHPFIVGLNYAFQTETKLFLILDFCPGGDLGRVLQREGRLNEERARKYLCEVLLAIEALHKRDIIFRDLKPDNVVIDTDGHACLTDFGLSKEGVFDPSRGAKSFCGSVAYLAPEMIRKAGHGKSVDWYLLGVLLYEMIVGQPPYFSESKDQLFNNIQRGVLKLPVSMSHEAKNLIVHLLNRNPSKRLGASSGGAGEIKSHPFFQDIDWDVIQLRQVQMPAPRYTYDQFKKQYENFSCTEEQKRQIFEDQAVTQDSNQTSKVEGWSFVQRGDDHGPMHDVVVSQTQIELQTAHKKAADKMDPANRRRAMNASPMERIVAQAEDDRQ